MILLCTLTIFIIYIVMFFIKFDTADKNAIYHSILHNIKSENKSITLRLKDMFYFLTYPVQSPHFMMRYSSGKMFANYISNNIGNQIKSNLFWAYTLEKYNISHLPLVAQCDEVHCTEYKIIKSEKLYLEKQEFSTYSKQVEGSQIKLVPGKKTLWFENLDICSTNHSIFRIITLPHKIFAIWNVDINTKESSKLEWNIGDTKFQSFTNCETTLFEKRTELLKMCKKLLELHAQEFKDVLNLNWEVAYCAEKCVVLGGNSNLFDFNLEITENFKKEYLKFVK